MDNLKHVYIDQLQDLYSACNQSKSVVKELHAAAHNAHLKNALEAGVNGIDDGIETLESLIKSHDADPTGEFCKGMEGLVKEARSHGIDENFTDDDARDAVIITQYQRMAHYAIAGYGCCVAFAKRLGLHEDAAKIQTCLDASHSGDQTMTEIAQAEVNKNAAA